MDIKKQVSNPYQQKIIVVDWGTTSMRCTLVDTDGRFIAETESNRGIQFIENQEFEVELMTALMPWFDDYGPLPVIALGMITSRNGWFEVPYVPCPVSTEDLARGIQQHMLPNGSDLYFLAGITDKSRYPFPDVMRGEETQILGFGLQQDCVIVLPGTHSKWAQITPNIVQKFQTFVTGEIYALMSQHSFIAKAAAATPDTLNWDSFERGATIAKSSNTADAAFLTQLMSVRTGMLANELQASEMLDYVSGLLIGHEFRQAQECGWFEAGDTIGIVGNDGLNERYCRVAKIFDLNIKDGGEQAAISGALKIFSAFVTITSAK